MTRALRRTPKIRGIGPLSKIFIDYLRNSRGASAAAAFTARARPGVGVTMPISWNELTEVKGGDFWNIRNAYSDGGRSTLILGNSTIALDKA